MFFLLIPERDRKMEGLTARKTSPIFPPELRYVTTSPAKVCVSWSDKETFNIYEISDATEVPLRSVETPVAKSPFEATAKDPPRSTIERYDSELEY